MVYGKRVEKYAASINVIFCRTSQLDGGQVKISFYFQFGGNRASCKTFLVPMQK
jgi:hypothetical protein